MSFSKKLPFLLLSLLLLVSPAMAGESIKEYQVTGEGVTYKDALYDALVNGLGQIQGFNLKSVQTRENKVQEISSYLDDQAHSAGNMNSVTSGKIDFKTEGFVQNYEVLDRYTNDSGLWEVVVLLKVSKYETPGISPDSRRKLAVVPFRSTFKNYEFNDETVPGDVLSRELSQQLINEFTQSRKFTVIDRDFTSEYKSERDFLRSGDAAVSEQIKLGEALGVDYLVVGQITDASQTEEYYEVRITGKSGYRHTASMTVDYRIIVMATRQIKWSGSVTTTLDDDFFKEQLRSSPGRLSTERLRSFIVNKTAKDIVNSAMDNIYPIRVAAIQENGQIILNQGGVTLAEGEILELYGKGEIIYDPVTKESLGSEETWLGAVRVDRVTAKMSYVHLIDGSAVGLKVGDICRRIKVDPNQGAVSPEELNREYGRESNVDRSGSGGVYLPFD